MRTVPPIVSTLPGYVPDSFNLMEPIPSIRLPTPPPRYSHVPVSVTTLAQFPQQHGVYYGNFF